MNGQVFVGEMQATFVLRQPKVSKPTNVYLICRVQGKQVKLSTGVKVYPDQWNKKKQEAYVSFRLPELDNRNNEITNSRINDLKCCFSDYKKYLCDNPDRIVDSLDILREYIYKDNPNMKQTSRQRRKPTENIILELRKMIDADTGLEEGSKERYFNVLNTLKSYLESINRQIGWKDLTLSLVKDFEVYVANTPVRGKLPKSTSVWNKMSCLLTVLRKAEQYEKIDFEAANLHKYKKPKKEEDNSEVSLSLEEIDRMYSLPLAGIEEQIRDLFVLQCNIGQRYSDLMLLNEGIMDIEQGIVTIVQKKTGKKVVCPLSNRSIEILK